MAGARPGRRDPRRSVGALGEATAAAWYEDGGYEVLDRNWRCRDGEIDLVVARDRVIVFCEEKTRRGDAFGVPAEAVTPAKQRRIRGLATRWLAERRVRAPAIRFDVASVKLARGEDPQIEIITDAF